MALSVRTIRLANKTRQRLCIYIVLRMRVRRLVEDNLDRILAESCWAHCDPEDNPCSCRRQVNKMQINKNVAEQKSKPEGGSGPILAKSSNNSERTPWRSVLWNLTWNWNNGWPATEIMRILLSIIRTVLAWKHVRWLKESDKRCGRYPSCRIYLLPNWIMFRLLDTSPLDFHKDRNQWRPHKYLQCKR